jgi:outer membrane receptor protein involved in Fe transport
MVREESMSDIKCDALKSYRNDLRLAVRHALAMSAMAAAGAAFTPAAYSQQQAVTSDSSLEEVVVTGSRIRRVDAETASPIFTIDQSAIQESGKTTVGDLIMQLPSVGGQAMNPATNNGGGFGESYIELRGLDAKRTVILLDGRRIGLIGAPGSGTSAVDVNQIPLAIIDHIEVLKEGAGAIYGSDAIAGVVNFITRKDVTGLEVSADYGRTGADDGAHNQLALTLGEQGEKLGFLVSGRYQKQDPVLEGRRSFSKFALYDYSGTVSKGGSSRTPTGRINVPAGGFAGGLFAGCDSGSVTKIAGAPGGSLANYRCFNSGGPNDDHYNYAPVNYLETPQERGSLFSKVDYHITDTVDAYGSFLYNRTRSGFQFASLPLDATSDNIVIAANNVYNPFGVAFGGVDGVNPDAKYRLLGLGPRFSDSTSTTAEGNFGFKGALFDTGWNWDLFSQYGRLDQTEAISGYFFSNLLSQALGPSFIGAGGVPTCGTPAAPISGCTPIDIFDVNDPLTATAAQKAAFQAISTGYNTDHTYTTRNFALDLNGKVLTLPAGDMQASAGVDYRWQEGLFQADQIVQGQPPYGLTCEISSETCTGNARLHYSNTDVYGELFAPLLKDQFLAKALNVDLGIRYSKYTLFDANTKGQIKLEYRPVSDLLIRGTFSQIYRAPTVQDLAQAPASSSTGYVDPCNGLTAAKAAANPNYLKACANVALDGSFQEQDAQINGVLQSNPHLKPEQGEVATYGFVYDSSLLPNFSFSADFWHYTITNVLTQIDPTFASNQCIATGAPLYCNLAVRYGAGANAGQIQAYLQPTENVGTLKTDGVDIGLKYAVRNTPIGTFKFSTDVTHMNSHSNSPGGGAPTVEYAGTYSRQFGNETKWRGLLSASWGLAGFQALVTEQWIGKLEIPNGQQFAPPPLSPNIYIPNIYYTNASVGYNFPTRTYIQFGMDNVFNRNPPYFYQNNVLNANTDVATYDVLGRRWYVSFTQKL